MNQIRLTKTPDIQKVLSYLQNKYHLLSEAEIIKVALSEKYYKETEGSTEKEQRIKQLFEKLTGEGRKLGDKFLKKKGLKREDVTEEEFYHLIKND